MHVLVVDDHAELGDLLQRALRTDGHVITVVGSLAAADRALANDAIDIIVLDIDLPDGSGVDYCRTLRQRQVACPILVLTAHKDVLHRVRSLDSGADDFLSKPFAVAELRARVRALGRRGPIPQGLRIRVADAEIDFASRIALAKGAQAPLTAREWSVLDLLAARQGRIVPRTEILEVVWDDSSGAASASLDVIIGRIRRKLGDGIIRTVRGEGYAFGER
jgi:DNA-binding response OmpR family regulator